MLQFNCFICSKREKNGSLWQQSVQIHQSIGRAADRSSGDNALSVGSQPSSGKASQIAAVISTSSSILTDGLASCTGNQSSQATTAHFPKL